MNRRLHTICALTFLPLLAATPAAAEQAPSDEPSPEPSPERSGEASGSPSGTSATSPAASAPSRPVSVGYYAEAGMGATAFLAKGASYSAVGPNLELRLGRDLTSWFSLGLLVAASTHQATVPPPPEDEYYQLYSGGAEMRLGFLVGPIGLFADGVVGGGMVSSNILAKVDVLEPGERFSLMYGGGAGIEYQMENRHYAVGLSGRWMSLHQFARIHGVATRLYLRYTY